MCYSKLSHPCLLLQTALAEAVRQQKAETEESNAALVQKYGEEGAAAMQVRLRFTYMPPVFMCAHVCVQMNVKFPTNRALIVIVFSFMQLLSVPYLCKGFKIDWQNMASGTVPKQHQRYRFLVLLLTLRC